MFMTKESLVAGLNKDGMQALVRLINLIGTPALVILAGIAINQFDTIIKNQEAGFEVQAEHKRRLDADSIALAKLVKADHLFIAKQDACLYALDINSAMGKEWKVDYDKRRNVLIEENKFLNP